MTGLELSVQGRTAATGVRIVDDIIMDERGGVEQLERTGCLSQTYGDVACGPGADLTSGELETPPQQDGTDPLAPASELDERFADRRRIG